MSFTYKPKREKELKLTVSSHDLKLTEVSEFSKLDDERDERVSLLANSA